MKLNASILAILAVITLAVFSTTFRVSTAPERIRQRLDAARAACEGSGGAWVKVGREESCQPPGAARKL